MLILGGFWLEGKRKASEGMLSLVSLVLEIFYALDHRGGFMSFRCMYLTVCTSCYNSKMVRYKRSLNSGIADTVATDDWLILGVGSSSVQQQAVFCTLCLSPVGAVAAPPTLVFKELWRSHGKLSAIPSIPSVSDWMASPKEPEMRIVGPSVLWRVAVLFARLILLALSVSHFAE